LGGHAYGSWRARKTSKMWLRDFFSKDLPNSRTMIYGYNSKLASTSIHTIRDYNLGFLEDLKNARKTNEARNRVL
jgi:hypothetical protein